MIFMPGRFEKSVVWGLEVDLGDERREELDVFTLLQSQVEVAGLVLKEDP
jgi:hypothetical protein